METKGTFLQRSGLDPQIAKKYLTGAQEYKEWNSSLKYDDGKGMRKIFLL